MKVRYNVMKVRYNVMKVRSDVISKSLVEGDPKALFSI